MPTRPLFAGGVGFSPGSVRYMPTLGLTPAGAATELTITCHGLPNSIHVQVEFEDEGWTGTDVSGFVEVYLGGAWHDGTALFKSYGVDELHGCIFGLSPNTTYPVRVTFRRPPANNIPNINTGSLQRLRPCRPTASHSLHCDHCSGDSQRHCDPAILGSPITRRVS